METGKLEQIFDTRGKFTLSIAYSTDGHWIASGALDGIINIFDANTGEKKTLYPKQERNQMENKSITYTF